MSALWWISPLNRPTNSSSLSEPHAKIHPHHIYSWLLQLPELKSIVLHGPTIKYFLYFLSFVSSFLFLALCVCVCMHACVWYPIVMQASSRDHSSAAEVNLLCVFSRKAVYSEAFSSAAFRPHGKDGWWDHFSQKRGSGLNGSFQVVIIFAHGNCGEGDYDEPWLCEDTLTSGTTNSAHFQENKSTTQVIFFKFM